MSGRRAPGEMTIARAYATLGLDGETATPEATASRFRRLIREHHPDRRPPRERAAATVVTRELIEAYQLLRAAGFPRLAGAAETGSGPVADAGAPFDDVPFDGEPFDDEPFVRSPEHRGEPAAGTHAAPEREIVAAALSSIVAALGAVLAAIVVLLLEQSTRAPDALRPAAVALAVVAGVACAVAAARHASATRRRWCEWARATPPANARRAVLRRVLGRVATAVVAIVVLVAFVVGFL